MKTKMKRQGSTELPRIAVGALAIAGASAANAATVQITLTGNKISSTSAGGNTLEADLTGDGIDDVVFAGMVTKAAKAAVGFADGLRSGRIAFANNAGDYGAQADLLGGGVYDAGGGFGQTPRDTRYLNPISFTDSRVNGGAATNGWLESHAFNISMFSHTVEFTRLIFDEASVTRPALASIPGVQREFGGGGGTSAVPEASTSLGLLALGAGGLLTRRRQKRAA